MPENQEVLVSIITINYNQLGVTCEMLDSLRKLSFQDYEVIVVDNASKENPEPHLRLHYPEAKVIVSNENLGFSGGNNLGIKASKGKFLFFVNNDTVLTEGLIEHLVQLFDKVPKLGLVSPKICYYENVEEGGPDIIQYAGATPVSSFTARNEIIGEKEIDKGQFTQAEPTSYAHGAAMMMSRKVMNEVGMMPEEFFLYYEELDWCEQVRRAGYEIYIEPNAMIYHKESISVGKVSTLKTYYLTRNRIFFMRRNRSKMEVFIFSLFLLFVAIPKNLLLYIIKGETKHIGPFLKGIWWNASDRSSGNSSKMFIPA